MNSIASTTTNPFPPTNPDNVEKASKKRPPVPIFGEGDEKERLPPLMRNDFMAKAMGEYARLLKAGSQGTDDGTERKEKKIPIPPLMRNDLMAKAMGEYARLLKAGSQGTDDGTERKEKKIRTSGTSSDSPFFSERSVIAIPSGEGAHPTS